MGWFVFGIIVLIPAVILFLVGNRSYKSANNYTYDNNGKKVYNTYSIPLRWVGVGLAFFAGLMFLASAVYTQDPGEAILIRSPGGSVLGEPDTSSGYGFTAPWNKTTTFNIRNQRIEMFTNEGGEGEDGAAIGAPSKEGTNVDVSITARYSIRPDCVEEIYNVYKSEDRLREVALQPGLRDEVRRATAKYSVFEIKQRRGELTTDIITALDERWGTDELCISVDDVDLGDLGLDKDTELALTEIINRQADVEAERADLAKSQIEAEITKTDAQAAQAADQIVRCGATVTTETREINGVETEIDIVTPVAIDKCQNLLNEQVLTNNYIEALVEISKNGNLIAVDGNINSILNLTQSAARVE